MSTIGAHRCSLAEIVEERADAQGGSNSYSFLLEGGTKVQRITYSQLDRRARAVAANLQSACGPGDRVIVLVPPGIGFVAASFGSLYAGTVLVPSIAPTSQRRGRTVEHIRGLAGDCGAAAAIVEDHAAVQAILAEAPDLAGLRWMALADIGDDDAGQWRRPAPSRSDLAVLQYTSGSTQHPKGVMISHDNLMANLAFLQDALCRGFAVEGVMWVPPYHDMGLVGGIFLAAFNGHHVTLLSPVHFLQRPIRWLEAISRNRATHTAAPNFALDLCVRRTTPEQRAALDLRSLKLLMSGGEPVRAETLRRFAETFREAGFDPDSLTAAYGLAESTLMATTAPVGRPTVFADLDAQALRQGGIKAADGDAPGIRLVSCGAAKPGSLAILDPERDGPAAPGAIGEIFLSGPSVAAGYWNRRAETEAAFGDIDGHRYFRTGDLGFVQDGELFVVGRKKDTIIIHGQNHHPHDVEETVEASVPGLVAGGSAAFGIEIGGEERLAVVAEVDSRSTSDFDEIVAMVRRGIAARHDLPLHRLTLIRRRGLAKTTSGKVRRGEVRRLLLAGELPVVHDWQALPVRVAGTAQVGGNGTVMTWLRQQIAMATGAPVGDRLGGMLLSELGLGSVQTAELLQHAEAHFGRSLPLSEMPFHLTLDQLAALISGAALPGASTPDNGSSRGKPAGDGSTPHLGRLEDLRGRLRQLEALGLQNPFFLVHDGTARATARIADREQINFGSYNYLGLSGHPAVNEAAKRAIDAGGTSVSASRLVSGERSLHRDLERAIAKLVGTEDAVVFVSGNLTNVTVLGHLAGPADLIVCDALAHDSILQGAKLSGASHRVFPHNDWRALDALLSAVGTDYRSIFIAIEGVYSMDGDIPDLPRFIEVKRRHGAWLMVDEAHSIGVLGQHGRGIREHAGVDPADVDLWMGTLSKAFASCGGYIAASGEIVQYLKYTTPGFVFSVGMPPPAAAAALAAIRQLEREPERVARLHERASAFLAGARAAGLDTGLSGGSPIIPVILGDSHHAIACSARLRQMGVSAHPIVHPAVQENAARLRFFICADHMPEQIETALSALKTVVSELEIQSPPGMERMALASAGAQL